MAKIHRLWILMGMIGLLLGLAVYLVDRPPEKIYFIFNLNPDLSLYRGLPRIFGRLGNWLPEFLHPFSFILLAAGISACRKQWQFAAISLFWLLMNVVFELGQKYKDFAVSFVPDWFSGIPYLENTRDYFLAGRFDPADLAAVILGSLAAYVVLVLTTTAPGDA